MRIKCWMRKWAVVASLALAGCASYFAAQQLDERYGTADPARYDGPPPAAADKTGRTTRAGQDDPR